jgi:PAS domain S-box-containing protein
MLESVAAFFNSDDFMPHGHCFLWQPHILWLHIISDAGIAAAYYALPVALIYLTRKRKDLPFKNVFWLFGAFILLCGTTHLLAIWVLWHPDYAVEGVVKAATALVSLATLAMLIKLIPEALQMVSADTKALADSEMLLRAIVDNTAEGLITMNEYGIIQTFNKACERIFGYQPKEVIGKNVKVLMPEPTRGAHDSYLERYKQTGQGHIIGTVGREIEGLKKDGTVFPLELSINVISVRGQRIFSGILRDISERRRTQQALELVTDGTSVGIYDHDVLNNAFQISPKYMNMIGVPTERKSLSIEEWRSHIHPDDAPKVAEARDRHFSERTPLSVEYRLRCKDGNYRWMQSIGQAAWDHEGRPIRLAGTLNDITERKEGEERLQRAIAELTESNLQLERFAYICSHDMQEPLRMISNYTQRLSKHLDGNLDDKGKHYMKYITDGADNARALIADVLTYARIGNETEKPEMIDCNEVVKKLLVTLEPAIQESRAHITCAPLPVIAGHITHITQLFQNLLTNAIKFRGENEPSIYIQVWQKGDMWQFAVSDNGIGIAPEYQERVFVIFQRLNKRSEYPGTGIGLAICKKIIEEQGGNIWLESQPDKGTTFFFTIPVTQENEYGLQQAS